MTRIAKSFEEMEQEGGKTGRREELMSPIPHHFPSSRLPVRLIFSSLVG
jgi:hypothetical protein